jgi:hypothetical protein
VTLLATSSITRRNGMVLHAVSAANNWILVYMDGLYVGSLNETQGPTGQPGIGTRETPSGNSISLVQLGPLDRVAPAAVDSQSIRTTPFPNSVDIQFKGVLDDASGAGLMGYQFWRDGQYICLKRSALFTDDTVQAGTTYSYRVAPLDVHGNEGAPATFTVRTPPAGYPNPRRVGVRPTGSYWGAAGEQINTLSGNLNCTLPLLKAMGRGNWGVTFALSYNSQMWRKDDGGTWKFSHNTGYGFGWKLQAGSLAPSWSHYWTLHHYTFTDSSGAEYRLDVNTNGVWTSREGVYLEYDSASRRLYFPDGSFWVFDCQSAGTEFDAGVLYPTLMEDANGNQVKVRYKPGRDVPWADSSGRIYQIEDVRAHPSNNVTYEFTFDDVWRLTQINNYIGTGERYWFYYQNNQPLNSLFPPYESFGTTTLLSAMESADDREHFFYYETGSGELTKVVLPYKGYLRWQYRSFTLAGNRTHREVQYRYLAPSAGAAELTYTFYHDDPGDQSRPLHAWTVAVDASGLVDRYFGFVVTPSDWR